MNLFKKSYYQLSSWLPLHSLESALKGSVLLPYQHVVSDDPLPHIRHIYPFKNITQFRNDLDVLLKNFIPVSADDVVHSFRERKPLPDRAFLLSFDDGFREMFEIVAPELSAKGIPAVFFVCPAFLDNRKLFYRNAVSLLIEKLYDGSDQQTFISTAGAILESNYPLSKKGLIRALKKIKYADKEKMLMLASLAGISYQEFLDKQRPYLSMVQVKKLASLGFSIGAHSWDHPDYHILKIDEQLDQTSSSMAFVNEHFRQNSSLFAFPHSDKGVGTEFFRRMDLEYPYIDLYFGIQNQQLEQGNRVLHRFNAERPSPSFENLLKGMLFYSKIRQWAGMNFIKR